MTGREFGVHLTLGIVNSQLRADIYLCVGFCPPAAPKVVPKRGLAMYSTC